MRCISGNRVDENTRERHLRELRQVALVPGEPVGVLRERLSVFYRGLNRTKPPDVTEFTILDRIPAFRIVARESREDRIILFFHSGGFSTGSTRDHLDFCHALGACSGSVVIGIDYRLAPEHPFPAAVCDCIGAFRSMRKEYPGSCLVPVGLSAGGTLILGLLLWLKKNGIPLPPATVALSPVVDMAFSGNSISGNRQKDWISQERLNGIRDTYLPDGDLSNPLASPVFGNFSGSSPILIQAGGDEVLLSDILRFARILKSQGVPVTTECYPAMFHCWQLFFNDLPAARDALRNAGVFIHAHCRGMEHRRDNPGFP